MGHTTEKLAVSHYVWQQLHRTWFYIDFALALMEEYTKGDW